MGKSVAPSFASDPAQASSTTVGAASFSSVAGLPSSIDKSPLLPSPDLGLDNSVAPTIAPVSVPLNSIVTGTTINSFGGSSSIAMPHSASWAAKVKAPIKRVTYPIFTNSGVPRVRIPTAIFKEGAARHREFVALTFLDKTPSMLIYLIFGEKVKKSKSSQIPLEP
uniref:Uncharacterized protein n=1 Tax=Noccaea caerulescens TaxID=107243 RepID=A0A1J3FHT4_NOCCA